MILHQKYIRGTSLVVQWLGIRLPMQAARVRSPVGEGPTCHGATKPVCHNCWACTLEPVSHSCWARVPQPLKPAHLEPVLHNKRGHLDEKPAHGNEEWPSLATTRESPYTAMKTQGSRKKKRKRKKKSIRISGEHMSWGLSHRFCQGRVKPGQASFENARQGILTCTLMKYLY